MKIIFLDFDGVLHSHYGPGGERFYFLPRFEAVIRDFPDARIVVASSWQLTHDLPALCDYFSPDIRERVIGISEVTREQALTWYGKRHRIAAAHRFLKANSYEHLPWVAIDDEPSFWQPGAPLIHCRDGFQDIEEQLLRWVLGGKVNADPGSLNFMDTLLRHDLRGDLGKADLAQRFYEKHYLRTIEEDEIRNAAWFESVCASDPEFVELLIDQSTGGGDVQ